jgi:hypothetical protein
MAIPNSYHVLTSIKYQAIVILVFAAIVGWVLWLPDSSGANVATLDRATFLSYLGPSATLLALFCSISLTWILFVIQRDKAERVTTFDLMKARLHEAQQWLLSQPESDDRELCLSLVWELDKHRMSDLPMTDWGDEYLEYTEALVEGLGDENAARRQFYRLSAGHFGYIEELLSRIGIISIRQVISRLFVQTFGKGLAIVAAAVLLMVCVSIWFGSEIKPWYVVGAAIVSVSTVLLLLEVFVDIHRMYEEELEFVGSSNNDDEDVDHNESKT